MRLSFTIPTGEHSFYYTLLPNGQKEQIICHEGVIFLGIRIYHNHRYELRAYLYKQKRYIYPKYYNTKTKLYSAIQKLLQEEL